MLITHALDQDIFFVATPIFNNFEEKKNNSNSPIFSQGGTDSQFFVPGNYLVHYFSSKFLKNASSIFIFTSMAFYICK